MNSRAPWLLTLAFVSAAAAAAPSGSDGAAAPLAPQPSADGDPVEWVLRAGEARSIVGGNAQILRALDPAGVDTQSIQSALAACDASSVSFESSSLPPEGDTATAAAFTPDGTRLIVSHFASHNLVVFDAAAHTVQKVIALSGAPNHVAVSSDNVHAAASNPLEDLVSIVDLNTGTEVAAVNTGNEPAFVRFTPDGTRVVVGNAVDQSISVVSVATGAVLHTIPGAGFVASLAVSFEPGVVTFKVNGFVVPSNSLAVHPDYSNDQIDFFDLNAGTVSSLPCDLHPYGIDMTPSGSKVVISHYLTTRKVTVVDPATQTISQVFSTSVDLDAPISIRPDGSKAALSALNSSLIMDLSTGGTSAALNTAAAFDMLSTADGQHALVVGFRGSLISYNTQTVVKELNNIVSTWVGAVSPAGQRAVLIANHFGEDALFVNTNGASGFLEARVPSGPPPESDATRKVAISADGTRAVTTNLLSDTASVIDLAAHSVLAVVPVGDRPADVEISPNGQWAVVANLDSTFATIINLSTFATTNVTISTRGSEVEISPDSQFAYVAVVSGGDGVWRINLNTQTVSGAKLPTGDMGSTLYLFNQASGMTLSHNGATLAVCGSFSNNVTLVNTATWSVAANVPVGTFPSEAVFSADDSRVYVANKNGNSVSVVSNAGAASTVLATIPVGNSPYRMAAAPGGTTLFVANTGSNNVGVVNLTTNAQTSTIPVGDFPQALHLNPAGTCLHVATGNWSVSFGPGPLVAIGRSGAVKVIDTGSLSVAQTIATNAPPAHMVFDASGTRGLIATPFLEGNGLRRIDTVPPVSTYCVAKMNSQGCLPPIGFSGSPSASAGSGFVISASLIVPNTNGLLLYSIQGSASIPFQGGTLCAQPPVRRTPVQNSGGSGSCGGSYAIDFNAFIAGGSDPTLQAGVTFWGQYWSRDPAASFSIGLTNAITGTIAN